MYVATLTRLCGKIETVDNILSWEVHGGFLYLNGTDFETFVSCYCYSMVDIKESST